MNETMKLVIVTDAWHPQVNGVVRTLDRTRQELSQLGHRVEIVSPQSFLTVPCPTYPEIRLSLASRYKVAGEIEKHAPDHIHIATEAMLGMAARRYCLSKGLFFTTSYHTRFPEYVNARFPIPVAWTYAYLRRFHNAGAGCMVATESLRLNLERWGFQNLMPWSRGVDADFFDPARRKESILPYERPVQLYVGRVAVEKNLEAFLSLETPGTKVVVGDGPARAELAARFPEARFLGTREGDALADIYASADVFVFPSKTDTYGIVLLEALASGIPVAAYPVMGPADVVGGEPGVGVLSEDLGEAVMAALQCDRHLCRRFARNRSWRKTAELFMDNIVKSRDAALALLAA